MCTLEATFLWKCSRTPSEALEFWYLLWFFPWISDPTCSQKKVEQIRSIRFGLKSQEVSKRWGQRSLHCLNSPWKFAVGSLVTPCGVVGLFSGALLRFQGVKKSIRDGFFQYTKIWRWFIIDGTTEDLNATARVMYSLIIYHFWGTTYYVR